MKPHTCLKVLVVCYQVCGGGQWLPLNMSVVKYQLFDSHNIHILEAISNTSFPKAAAIECFCGLFLHGKSSLFQHSPALTAPYPASASHSWLSSVRHFKKSSFRASGLIWFRMPPSRLEVASEATMRGSTTVGGICRSTPPTAPGKPFCSCPRDATLQRVWAVSITP